MTQATETYDPARHVEVTTTDIVYRESGGHAWDARIYRPVGNGVYPALIEIHGGAWQGGSHLDAEYVDRAMAASGLVVAAIDFRVAPADPYPAQVVDVNYGIRWWKANAEKFGGNASRLGALGISSGGQTVMLTAMRAHDKRYTVLPLDGKPQVDATIDYYVGTSPVLDPHARYLYAKEAGRESLVSGSLGYFLNEETMREASPQLILERGEKVHLPPALVIHGLADESVPNATPTRFEQAYRKAGGSIDLKMFEGMPHSFVRTPGPETEEAIVMIKAFIARQLAG